MGYFSNNTEHEMYAEDYCYKCVHAVDKDGYGACMVMMLHQLYNYQECNKKDSMLHMLIPCAKDGCRNEKCTMFHENKPEYDRRRNK